MPSICSTFAVALVTSMYVWLVSWNSGFPRPGLCTLALTTFRLNESLIRVAVMDLNVGGGSGVELCVLVTEVDVAVVGYSSSVLTSLGPQQSTLCVWICYHCGVESVPPVESRQCHHTPDVATPLKDPPVDNSV